MNEITWPFNEYGSRVFTHGPWSVTVRDGWVDVSHTDKDIEVEVESDEIAVMGEIRSSYASSAIRVRIPFIVLRAIMEAAEVSRG